MSHTLNFVQRDLNVIYDLLLHDSIGRFIVFPRDTDKWLLQDNDKRLVMLPVRYDK